MMHAAFLVAALIVVVLMLPYLARVATGPSVFDRLVGLNALGTKVAVLLVLVGLLYDRAEMFVDLALALFVLNLITTLLFARYAHERRPRSKGGPA